MVCGAAGSGGVYFSPTFGGGGSGLFARPGGVGTAPGCGGGGPWSAVLVVEVGEGV